jgi:exopolyphosphatase/guanosine-5'-triphosphate,3'-diphosphate pyrophosphatase
MKSAPIASIDLGTNTARLLIGTCVNGRVERLRICRRITRLGGGFTREHGISPEAAERTLAAMKDFAVTLREYNVEHLRAVATSAVRDAANGTDFCRIVENKTGIRLEVISGDEEGRLTLLGVNSGLDKQTEVLLVFDVGGGSTEYTIAANSEILFTASLPLGVVRLTEGKGAVAAMDDKIRRELAQLLKMIAGAGLNGRLAQATLVGTAGTATTLAAIDLGLTDYDYRKVNNHHITASRIKELLAQLLPLSPVERLQQIAGLEEGREDLIVAGTLLTLASMEMLGFSSMKVSDYGLLEGVLLDLAAKPATCPGTAAAGKAHHCCN